MKLYDVERIREAVDTVGSYEAFAELAGIHATNLTRMFGGGGREPGTANISLRTLFKIADAMKVEAAELIAGIHLPRKKRK